MLNPCKAARLKKLKINHVFALTLAARGPRKPLLKRIEKARLLPPKEKEPRFARGTVLKFRPVNKKRPTP